MHEGSVSVPKLVATAWWLVVAGLLIAAWVTFAIGPEHPWQMLGLTACVASAVAAVAQVRCYAVRITNVIRLANGLDAASKPERGLGLYAVRNQL